MIESVS